MNIYNTQFFCNCPNNGVRILYSLRIETKDVIRVESIISTVECIDDGFHEEIADRLIHQFGGRQTLTAEHHGVRIETTRAAS